MTKTKKPADIGPSVARKLYGWKPPKAPKTETYFKQGAPSQRVTCKACGKPLKAKNALQLGNDWFHKVCAPAGAVAPVPQAVIKAQEKAREEHRQAIHAQMVAMSERSETAREAQMAQNMAGSVPSIVETLPDEDKYASPVVGGPIKGSDE